MITRHTKSQTTIQPRKALTARVYLIALILALVVCPRADAAWSLCSGFPIAAAGDTSNVPATASQNTTACSADLIAIWVSWYNGGTKCTPSDSLNTWNALTAALAGGANAISGQWYYASNGATTNPPATSTTHSFLCGSGNLDYPAMVVYAFSGSVGGSSFDAQNTNTALAVTSLTTNTVTPSSTSNLSLIGLDFGAANTPLPSATGYTATGVNYSAGANMGAAAAYKAGGLSSPESATWSWTTSADGATGIATFKASGVAGCTAPASGLALTRVGNCKGH